MKIHRLVLLVFIGECPEGMECDHIDRNKANNHIDNLRWVTKYENMMNRSVTLNMTNDEKRLRKNIQTKESHTRIRRSKGMKKQNGCIEKTPSGKFIGRITINSIKYASKSLPTRNEAQHFINQSVAFDWLKNLIPTNIKIYKTLNQDILIPVSEPVPIEIFQLNPIQVSGKPGSGVIESIATLTKVVEPLLLKVK
jgi:hypothetical protein